MAEGPVGYAAPWILTGYPGERPIREGAIVLDQQGRVLAVGARAHVAAKFPALPLREERAILLPGLVNAHVHLELSALRGHTQSGGGFGPWVASMMAKRASLAPEQDSEAIDAAVSELLRAGTVAIGEVTNTLQSLPALRDAPLLGRVFHELFGYARDLVEVQRAPMEAQRGAHEPFPRHLSYVVAPHTLYTLHGESVRSIVASARERGVRTSLHLAEHAAERAFLRDGGGPFAEFLKQRNIALADFAPPGLSPVAYAEQLGVLGPALIAVHLAAADREELAKVVASGSKVVLCPRSNLYIELKLPPLFDMLALGITPGLGTDSLASNTTLDVLAEAAALRDRFPQVDPLTLLSMATWYGAEALELSHRVGALREGLSPGLLAVELAAETEDPLRIVLRSPPPARRVLARPLLPKGAEKLEDEP